MSRRPLSVRLTVMKRRSSRRRARRTSPRIHRGVLVVGCWRPHIIPNLRKSAEAVWPQVQERLQKMWKLSFRAMEIIPCDPPAPAEPRPRRDPDALKAVLDLLRTGKKG